MAIVSVQFMACLEQDLRFAAIGAVCYVDVSTMELRFNRERIYGCETVRTSRGMNVGCCLGGTEQTRPRLSIRGARRDAPANLRLHHHSRLKLAALQHDANRRTPIFHHAQIA